MKSEFVRLIKNKLSQRGIFSIGCSRGEIKRLEDYAGSDLPRTYQDFLAHFGRGAGRHLDDINIFFDRIFENRNSAEEVISETESGFALKETDFVFSSYQGSQFSYFSLNEGDDPPVYFYSEASDTPVKTDKRFSEWIIDLFEDIYGKMD